MNDLTGITPGTAPGITPQMCVVFFFYVNLIKQKVRWKCGNGASRNITFPLACNVSQYNYLVLHTYCHTI